jgi:hypothetical protein
MLTLTPAGRPLDRRTLTTPGGFCWWYGDVIDGDGNGVVVIGSFGLPFLARRGELDVPQQRPSLNLAVYERGICTFYGLQELGDPTATGASMQDPCAWTDGDPTTASGARWRFANSLLGYDVSDGEGRFFADLDVTLPVGRAVGRIAVAGPTRDPAGHGIHTLGTPNAVVGSDGAIAHDWSPQLGPSRGTATLRLNEREVTIEGSGYHDRNGALLPLTDQGIAWWLWARADVDVGVDVDVDVHGEGPGRESRVVYALWPTDVTAASGVGSVCAVGVATDATGATRLVDVDVDVGALHRTWLGMGEVRRLRVGERLPDGSTRPFLTAVAGARVDDGPFYLRHTIRAGINTAPAHTTGFLEVVDVRRMDRPWQRPFVKMRVSPPPSSSTSSSSSSSSLWHPLFAGPRAGRAARQLRWLLGDRS